MGGDRRDDCPRYAVNDGRGRPTIALEIMLRMYVAQQCFGLSDEGIEDALYDSQAIRRFVGIDLGRLRRMPPRCATSAICWKSTS